MVVPEAIAYAGLAGLPPQAGPYTILIPLVAYAVFGTSRQMVATGTSASADLLASTIHHKSSRPHGALLGRVPRVPGVYTDLERHPENQPVPGTCDLPAGLPSLLRQRSLVRERVKALIKESKPPAKALLFDMTVNDRLDITGAEMLVKLVNELEKDGTMVIRIFPNVDAGVQYYLERQSLARGQYATSHQQEGDAS